MAENLRWISKMSSKVVATLGSCAHACSQYYYAVLWVRVSSRSRTAFCLAFVRRSRTPWHAGLWRCTVELRRPSPVHWYRLSPGCWFSVLACWRIRVLVVTLSCAPTVFDRYDKLFARVTYCCENPKLMWPRFNVLCQFKKKKRALHKFTFKGFSAWNSLFVLK